MKYYLINAEEKILGRLATEVAQILRGKNRPDFSPHKFSGDAVVVINSDKILVSGKKRQGKLYHRFSGYPGGIKSITFEEQMKKDSREVLRNAIYGMLPKNKLRKLMLKNLFIYKDEKHPHKIG